MVRPTQKVIDLGYKQRAWQREASRRRAGKRFSVWVLHRRAGKTKWALMEKIDRALKFDKPNGRFAYIAPLLKQAKSVAWDELKTTLAPLIEAGGCDVSEGELWVRFKSNGAQIRLWGADNYDAMRGLRLDGVTLDEVAQMPAALWDEVLRACLADRSGWAVFLGTVSGVDLLSETYTKAGRLMDEGDVEWTRGLWTVHDTDALPLAEIKRLQDEMSPRAFARELLCDFTAQGDDQLVPLSLAFGAAERCYKEHDISHAPRIIGVDPARFGDDRSVIIRRQGLQAFPPTVLKQIDNMDLAARVAFEIMSWKPHAVFIDAGYGSGVIDRLRQLGHDVIEVNFASKALKPGYLNRRAEMWCAMRDWLKAGGALPGGEYRDQLIKELATPTYWFSKSNGLLVLESKDEIRKRLSASDGKSPDIADSLALSLAAPVVMRTPFEEFAAKHPRDVSASPYDHRFRQKAGR